MSYYMKKRSKKHLETLGFSRSFLFSNEDEEYYWYRFPVYRYGDYILFECEMLCCIETGEVIIDVFDYKTRNRYASWYYPGLGFAESNKAVDIINAKIKSKCKQMGIIQVDE